MKLVVDIPGGFGNQLFGYAFGYALSKEVGCDYHIHTPFQDNGITWDLQIDYFNLKYDKRLTYTWTRKLHDRILCNKLRRRYVIGLRTIIARENADWELEDYAGFLRKHKNVMFFGNWENEKFFKKYRADILEMLTLKTVRSDEMEALLNAIAIDTNSVGVHIRRGDKAAMGAGLSAEYYNGALHKMEERLQEKATFYVVSDDIEWCKAHLHCDKADLIYPEMISDNRTLDDWLILKTCNHHIVANSTFSWWAAWLSQNPHQVVICPQKMSYKLDDWIGV